MDVVGEIAMTGTKSKRCRHGKYAKKPVKTFKTLESYET
jgi:hypothetical protein